MSILIFIIILLVLVLVHEAGHFFVAKKFGIRVDEFGFGFPPKIWGKKYGETEYSVNLLPLGGFVKIFGETPDDENTNGPDRARSFVHKPRWQQALVLVAGVFMNFILAWLLFSVGFMSGLPASVQSAETSAYELQDVNLVVLSVAKDSPAELAGLATGDKIVSVSHTHEGGQIHTLGNIHPETLQSFILEHSEEKIDIGYLRGKTEDVNVVEVSVGEVNGKPAIGIAMDEIGVAKMGFFKAFWQGLKFTTLLTKATAVGLFDLLRDGLAGRGSMESITGPVGLVGVVGDAYQFGFAYLISFAALISINLAIINLLPFPALDGGRLLFLLIEKIKGSPINVKVANTANSIGFIILILLMLLVTYHDIAKLL
ncbi:MAG: RIP metalloprotease RseP [bacterium]|nr:RIP metalloprotease RseP [bacterium]